MRLIIAGAGVSGLSLAHAVALRSPETQITVLEAQGRPGGKIWTEQAEGFLCESGVNGFLDNKPMTLQMAGELSLSPLRSNDNARKRYVFSDGILQRLPESPPAFLKSRLISLPGKLRMALEPFIARGGTGDESLADFGRRRLGREAFEKLIDPMASGIYAGDPEKLSLPSCFGRIRELEQDYGSLIRAMIKLSAQRRKSVGAAPGGKLTSFAMGMQEMVDALAAPLAGQLRLGSRVQGIEKAGNAYRVGVQGPGGPGATETLEAEAVAFAIPAHQLSVLMEGFEPAIGREAALIPYPPVSVVCTGFRSEKVKPSLEAFGFLVPFREGRRILGTLFDSSIFPNRAPEGHVLLRTMVGGARGWRHAQLPDEALRDAVLSDIRDATGLDAEPDFVRIYRHERAIPQYNLGHSQIVEKLNQTLEGHRGLYVTGNAFGGIGVNDCIAASYALAGRIIQDTESLKGGG